MIRASKGADSNKCVCEPALAEPELDPGGVKIKPPFEMGVRNLIKSPCKLSFNMIYSVSDKGVSREMHMRMHFI